MYRYLSVMIVGAALIGSVAVCAQEREGDRDRQTRGDHQSQRYYDKSGRDWHDWNGNEDRAYHQYLQEHHKKDRDFAHANSRDKGDYFKWRHEHPDSSDRH